VYFPRGEPINPENYFSYERKFWDNMGVEAAKNGVSATRGFRRFIGGANEIIFLQSLPVSRY
jgi:hypothetical protein